MIETIEAFDSDEGRFGQVIYQLEEEVTGVIHCHRRGNAGQEKHDRK